MGRRNSVGQKRRAKNQSNNLPGKSLEESEIHLDKSLAKKSIILSKNKRRLNNPKRNQKSTEIDLEGSERIVGKKKKETRLRKSNRRKKSTKLNQSQKNRKIFKSFLQSKSQASIDLLSLTESQFIPFCSTKFD